ncbi:intracellular growth attenuator family protein [Aquifex aeolicus]|uniref:intracellular growth attenuator family protein n=1 Tax=Aquifex aeolicus TaxID=63363 RepID=UPI0002EFD6EC|nr:intracellular growth attenuator family protein [Aquifex aeolicus]
MFQCFLFFLAGFAFGFLLAVALIVGITLIPFILLGVLIFMAYAYYKYRKEQKRREEILRRYYEDLWEE